jgi:hypothetical protein
MVAVIVLLVVFCMCRASHNIDDLPSCCDDCTIDDCLDDSKCSSSGNDCCAPLSIQETASCVEGYTPVRLNQPCHGYPEGQYTCLRGYITHVDCPIGHFCRPSSQFTELDGSCFAHFATRKNFFDAEASCQELGEEVHLATIESQIQSDGIFEWIDGAQVYLGLWSGAVDSCSRDKSTWVWISTGVRAGYSGSIFTDWGDGSTGQVCTHKPLIPALMAVRII